MSALIWIACCAFAMSGLVPTMAWWWLHRGGTASAERNLRPKALRDAELVYVEKLFRISKPIGLSAKLDRAYRLPSGLIVLVEFKTRQIDRPLPSDIIQVSVQRTVVMERTQQAVAPYGYVVVKSSARSTPVAHRVELLSDMQVIALTKRRKDILTGHTAPRCTASLSTCITCSFRSKCY